ncbi:MAG: hypothetical protein H6759_00490 [Candidatus Nomurabacteria bacterium]|nr:MAG: hypothetical protein H6759_00490 [Candidatus Nomurabacteria bacterium]
MPEIEYQYTIHADPGVLDKLTIRRLSITPDIGVRSSRQGWFDFSIAWHCETNDVETKDILTAIKRAAICTHSRWFLYRIRKY